MPPSNQAPEPTPYWVSDCGRAVVYVGDCRDVMSRMGRCQFHAVVTDPPYGLGKEPDVAEVMASWVRCGHHEVGGKGFMGKEWDAFVPQPATWAECVKVMKPGAHMLCFAGTRTLDWMGMSLRFVGLECRDMIMWVYGTGYPKGTNIGKAIDKELGFEREKIKTPMGATGNKYAKGLGDGRPWMEEAAEAGYHEHDGDVPVTDAARQWDGWNTAIKPSVEPIILSRKLFAGSVAECVMENGTGGLNIDACRVGTTGADVTRQIQSYSCSGSGVYQFNSGEAGSQSMRGGFSRTHKDGRWPANLCHDGSDEVVGLFPQEAGGGSGDVVFAKGIGGENKVLGGSERSGAFVQTYADGGSAARFFYTSKAGEGDRPHGKGAPIHPTVKPLDLMRWLVRLVCARGGAVLDPFMGSGSTGCAAIVEGMSFVGIEQSQEYADIAVGRLRLALDGAGPMEELKVRGKVAPVRDVPPPPSALE